MYLIGCLLVAYFANKRGRDPITWILLSLFITPIISGIILFLKEDLSKPTSIFDNVYKAQSTSGDIKQLNSSEEKTESRVEPCKQTFTVDVPQFKTCPHCGEEIRKGARTCRFCRMELGDDGHLICPHCGASVPKEYIFDFECPVCKGFIDYDYFDDVYGDDDDDDDYPSSRRKKRRANGGGAAAAAASSCGGGGC